MPSWWGKPPSKEGKRKKSRGNFFEAIHRRFKAGSENKKTANTGAVQRFPSDIRAEKGSTLSVSLSPSLEVSRCHSFAEEPRAQPLPLPVQLASVGYTNSDIRTSSMVLPVSPLFSVYDPRKPVAPDGWGDFGTASISSNSSFDTSDQPESRLFSPQASDYESGNVTAINSPSRLIDHSSLAARRLKDQGKLINLPSHDHTLRRRRPLSSHVTKLQIPPRAGFISAPDSSISSPSRSPVGVCSQKEVNRSDGCARRACSDLKCCSPGSGKNSGHDSVGDMLLVCPQSRCSAECSPILNPRMTSPSCRSRIQSGCTTPLHSRAGGHCNNLPLDKPDDRRPQSHKLPLPPVLVSNSLSRYPGRGESSPSPVSRWKKGRLIGSGTFGHVYMGFNSETGEMCAMKEVLLFSDDPNSKECVQQPRQEVTLLSSLTHPNIVQYFGSETVDNRLYIYLEYVSGGSIHKLLGDYGQLGESAIRSFTLQILSGLAYLHARHTVHRDIKGANILVDPSGRVKLADFGMAKHIAGQSGPLSFKGSPYWMAPEVIKNSDGSSLSVDIWSLGCTVIEMATAKPPWSQHEGVAALFKVGYSKELPAIPDHLSNEGKDFVRKCLQRNPLDRPSAAELLKHPFVKNLAPSDNFLSITEPSEVDNASRYTGSGHLSRGFDSGSRSSEPRMSKHLSCPVSPVRSPLLPSKSSQTTCRKRSPYISSPHTPGSSTPYKGSIRAHLYNSTCHSHEGITARMPQRSLFTNGDPLYRKAKEESLMGIPENSQVKRGTNFMSK